MTTVAISPVGTSAEIAQGVLSTDAVSRANRPTQTPPVATLPTQACLMGVNSCSLFTSMIPNRISTLTAPTYTSTWAAATNPALSKM